MSEIDVLDIHGILDFLPHRYPFLMVDRVHAFENHKWLTATKNVTYNEPFFQGHFPDNPIMPGVLIMEALAQATALLALLSDDLRLDGTRVYYLVGVDKARFKSLVSPGDVLRMRVEENQMVRGVGRCTCVASVDDKVVASAEIMGAIREIKP
ncbi:MAG: 3-hydroxyacyl-ACP dehydratase FabZ [Gammaproteobacteria bacterium]|nr:3-hydroxyacyl-ACP dehydratase FabZ [Gammaproteobacteria bacterium]